MINANPLGLSRPPACKRPRARTCSETGQVLIRCPGWPLYQEMLRGVFRQGFASGSGLFREELCDPVGMGGTEFGLEESCAVKGYLQRDWVEMERMGFRTGLRTWSGTLDIICAKVKELRGEFVLVATGGPGRRPCFVAELQPLEENWYKKGLTVKLGYRAGVADLSMIACASVQPPTNRGIESALLEMRQRLERYPGRRILLMPPQYSLMARRAQGSGLIDDFLPLVQLETKAHEESAHAL